MLFSGQPLSAVPISGGELVSVWAGIAPTQNAGYSTLTPAQNAGYTEIAPTQNAAWIQIDED